jgi:flagellar biosynthesis/type III secretory pathway protein FliH
MFKAKLMPAGITQDLSVSALRQTIKLGRTTIAQERKRSRAKSARYSRYIRRRGFSQGYQEGLAQGRNECIDIIKGLRSCYEEALNTAANDTLALATSIAERTIDTTLTTRPEALMAWISEGLSLLKGSREIHIALNKRYLNIINGISPLLDSGISIRIDGELSETDFIIEGSRGGIEFSWRSTIQPAYELHLARAA